MKRLHLISIVVLLLCTSNLWTQVDDFRVDSTFFQKQAIAYQIWLDAAGFGQYIQVKEVDVKEDKLVIFLKFKTIDIDSMMVQWIALKGGFEAHSDITLEEQLYYKAEALMEVPQSVLSVELFDSYDVKREILFQREIYFREGLISIDSSNSRMPIDTIKLFPTGIGGGTFSSLIKFQNTFTQNKAYACILTYARERFKDAGVDGISPEIRILENKKNLRFEVVDLRKEVLKDASICDWLFNLFELPCSWAKRERLTFQFTYKLTSSGVSVTGDISGKVGKGEFANSRRGSYLDLEQEYGAELADYIQQMNNELLRALKSCK